ncbi:MAG: hydrogenase maturation nickel metallochaperone HypA [Verrucomicrobia bacterium]|nr:hydrogenase maturation nickel metallochaperone HypA [Verrucomicrobiota bacterium]
MHEVGIIQNTLELAERSARASGATRIHRLRLRVGRMTGVVQEALEFAFEVAREGTMASEAVLEVETVPVSCWCARCGAEFVAEDWVGVCPRCGEVSGELRRGQELELASLEIS